MSKVIFVFNVDNVIDIITNSSSELFVFHSDSYDEIKSQLNELYENYEDEYTTLEEINLSDRHNSKTRIYVNELIYEKTRSWNWAYDLESRDKLLDKVGIDADKYSHITRGVFNLGNLDEEDYNKLIDFLHGGNKIPKLYCIISHNDNPNYDYQDILTTIAKRYHLG